MAQLNLKIVTPEKIIFDDNVDMVTVTTLDGELGILPYHVNLMSQVVPGQLQIKQGGKVRHLATGAGLLQMTDNILSITTDLAEYAEDIDEKAVEEARRRAQAALEQKLTDEEYAATVAILERSLAKLRVKRSHKVR